MKSRPLFFSVLGLVALGVSSSLGPSDSGHHDALSGATTWLALAASGLVLSVSLYRRVIGHFDLKGVAGWLRAEMLLGLAWFAAALYQKFGSGPTPWVLAAISLVVAILFPAVELMLRLRIQEAGGKPLLDYLRKVVVLHRAENASVTLKDLARQANNTLIWRFIDRVLTTPTPGRLNYVQSLIASAAVASVLGVGGGAIGDRPAANVAKVLGAVYDGFGGPGQAVPTAADERHDADSGRPTYLSALTVIQTLASRETQLTQSSGKIVVGKQNAGQNNINVGNVTNGTVNITTGGGPGQADPATSSTPANSSNRQFWSKVCGKDPGFDAPPWAKQIIWAMYLGEPNGLGASGGGCTTRTESLPGHENDFAFVRAYGVTKSGVRFLQSVAVVSTEFGATYFLAPAAQDALDLIAEYGPIGGSPRIRAGNGDVYAVWHALGTTALVRDETVDSKTGKTKGYVVVPPPVTDLWVADMQSGGHWLWVVDGGIEQQNGAQRFDFEDKAVGGARIDLVAYDADHDTAMRQINGAWLVQQASRSKVTTEMLEGLGGTLG